METIETIREFNRAYTATLGVLDNTYLDSDRTLTEIRVLYEISNSQGCSAKRIGQTLRLNEGYISRVIKKLEKLNLLKRVRSDRDKREYRLLLTDNGQKQINEISERADAQISELLEGVSEKDRKRLVGAMQTIKEILKI